jgi:uncharacterized membrane protein YsdA (DUF1294 family)/cold shock CspA family protein
MLGSRSTRIRFDGTLKSWNDERGLGLLAADQGGQDIVVQMEALTRVAPRPTIGQRFSFEIQPALGGVKRAHNVAAMPSMGRQAARRRHHQRQWLSRQPAEVGLNALLAIPAFAVALLGAAVFWHLPLWMAGSYALLSLAAFVAYAADKSAAAHGGDRSPEIWLLLLGLVGGWPGALLAQQLLRHKTRKASFQALFWLTVLINVAAFAVLASPLGQTWWR